MTEPHPRATPEIIAEREALAERVCRGLDFPCRRPREQGVRRNRSLAIGNVTAMMGEPKKLCRAVNSASGKSSAVVGPRERFGRGLVPVGQANLRRMALRKRDRPGAAGRGVDNIAKRVRTRMEKDPATGKEKWVTIAGVDAAERRISDDERSTGSRTGDQADACPRGHCATRRRLPSRDDRQSRG